MISVITQHHFLFFYNMKKAENDSVISDNHSRFLRPSPRGFEPPTPRLGVRPSLLIAS